jgi:hypothetical protein
MKPGRLIKCAVCLAVVLFLSPLNLSAQSPDRQQGPSPLLTSVVLVDRPDWMKEKDKGQTPPLPQSLLLGIEVKTGVFFKLTLSEGEAAVIITAGELHPGMNVVAIPTDRLFKGSGTFPYCLELKTAAVEEQVNFRLEVLIESLAAGSQDENGDGTNKIKTRTYEISLLIGNQLLHSIQKKDDTLAQLFSTGHKEPAPVVHDPLYPVPGTRPPAATISPLTLALMAMKGIRKRAKKRQQEKIHQVYTAHITGVFLRRMKDGENEPLRVTIKISRHPGTEKK